MEYTLIVSSVLLWVLLLLNLLLTLALIRKVNASAQPAKKEEGLRPGVSAPDFTAQTLQGEAITLATYAGRPVVFIFISTNCGPCRDAMPEYEALAPNAARAGIELVLVSIDETKATQAFVDELKISLSVIVAPRNTHSFYTDYKVPGTPSHCMVDAQGIVQSSGHTNQKWGDWKRYVDSWEQKEVSTSSR